MKNEHSSCISELPTHRVAVPKGPQDVHLSDRGLHQRQRHLLLPHPHLGKGYAASKWQAMPWAAGLQSSSGLVDSSGPRPSGVRDMQAC